MWISTSSLADSAMDSDSCRPRLFTYQLPGSYRISPHGLGKAIHMRNRVHAPLWDTDQYSLGSLLYERALAYRCRTRDPSNADLFFVPAFRGTLGTVQECAEPDSKVKLLQRLRVVLLNASSAQRHGLLDGANGPPTTLEARGGADHIILNPRSGMNWERYPYCELQMGSARLGAALWLSMESHPHNGSWVYPEGYCGKVCVKAYYPQLVSESFYWSVPWTSAVHLDSTSSSTPPWTSQHVRSMLVAAHFLVAPGHPGIPKPTLQLRQALLQQCSAQPTKCRSVPPLLYKGSGCSGIKCLSSERTALLYWDSTFCLQPGGDTITRKGIVDALLLGCIPVLFHTGQPAQWAWHWGTWVDDATVTFNQSAVRHGELDVISTLSAIPTARVAAMQASVRQHAHRMHYAAVDTSQLRSGLRGLSMPDAFEVILEGAWRVARDAKLQSMGRHVMRTNTGIGEMRIRQRRLAMASASKHGSEHASEHATGVEIDGATVIGRPSPARSVGRSVGRRSVWSAG